MCNSYRIKQNNVKFSLVLVFDQINENCSLLFRTNYIKNIYNQYVNQSNHRFPIKCFVCLSVFLMCHPSLVNLQIIFFYNIHNYFLMAQSPSVPLYNFLLSFFFLIKKLLIIHRLTNKKAQ